MRIYLRNREAIAMLLRSEIESGWAKPSARSALAKIQKSEYGYVDLHPEEVEAITDTFEDVMEEFFWTPRESRRLTVSPRRRETGPTRYLTDTELEEAGLLE